MRLSNLMRHLLLSTSLSTALIIVAAPLANAQTAVSDEVVVTGTRIASSAAKAPQPIQVLSAEDLAQRGDTSLADALDRLPALQASNSVEQTITDGAVTGRVALDLRGLGSARTLVLVNGRRHVAGSPGTASVDIASIPSGLIERVDVLTGGASAVYG